MRDRLKRRLILIRTQKCIILSIDRMMHLYFLDSSNFCFVHPLLDIQKTAEYYYLRKNKIPNVFGPQCVDIVHPAVVSITSSNVTYLLTSLFTFSTVSGEQCE